MKFKNLTLVMAIVCGISSAFADDNQLGQNSSASRFFMADSPDVVGMGSLAGMSPLLIGIMGRGMVRAHSEGSIARRMAILSEVPSDLELRGMVMAAKNRYALSHLDGGKIMVNISKSMATGERSYKTFNLSPRYIEIAGRSDEAILKDLKRVLELGSKVGMTSFDVGFFSKSAQLFSKGFLATGATLQGAGVVWDLGHLAYRLDRYHALSSQGTCGPAEHCENDGLLRAPDPEDRLDSSISNPESLNSKKSAN